MDGIISSRVHVSYDVDNGDSGKTALPIHISVLAVYEKDINPEIKINDIKRFIVNSSASVQYENISVVLSKRRDIIEQAPTYEISEPVFAYDKAMPVSILLALISVATCWLLWKYRAILTFFRLLSTRAIALIKFGSILNIVPTSLEQELLAKDIFVINIQNVKMVKNLTFGERIFFHV